MSARLPSVSPRNAIRAFERAGFKRLPARGKGSHAVLANDKGSLGQRFKCQR